MWLDCSFVMAVSPLYVSPRAKTISPLGRMSSCHSVQQQCSPLTIPYPSPNLWPHCVQPTHHISTQGCCTNDTEKQAQWQVRHFGLHYLLTGRLVMARLLSWDKMAKYCVVLILAILISLLSAIGGCFSMEGRREAAKQNRVLLRWNLSVIT